MTTNKEPVTKWRKDAMIKVMTLIEKTKANGATNVKEVMINIHFHTILGECSMSVPNTKKGKREALKFLQKELRL